MDDSKGGFLFRLAKKSKFLQNAVISVISSIHPSIEHNVEKGLMLKKALFYTELEGVEGSYFEFGIYEGASLLSAVKAHKAIKSKFKRTFYGFDSFDDGFKYFDKRDKHPFFKEGDFKSSYNLAKKRFKKYKNVKLVKGYFEDTVKGKKTKQVCGDEKCAVIFIDCDLMNPAVIALDFIKPIIQPGTVIILDDYWAYRADEKRGTCGALNKFLKENPSIKVRSFVTYGHGGMSFIVNAV